jgi:hypothetical protein
MNPPAFKTGKLVLRFCAWRFEQNSNTVKIERNNFGIFLIRESKIGEL